MGFSIKHVDRLRLFSCSYLGQIAVICITLFANSSFSQTQSSSADPAAIAQTDPLSDELKFFERKWPKVIPLSPQVSLVSFQDTSVHSASKAHLIRIVDLTKKRVIHDLMGAFPVAYDENSFLFSRIQFTDEVVVCWFDLVSMTSRQVSSKTRIGQMREYVPHPRGFTAKFNSNFIRDMALDYTLDGRETILKSKADLSSGIDSSRHFVQSTDNFVYPATLFRPVGTVPPKAVVVFVHGGGCHLRSEPFGTTSYNPDFAALVKRGFAIFTISYRNDSFFTPLYEAPNWGPENCGTKEVEDIIAANRYLRRAFPVSPVFLWGRSQGAYLANLTTTKFADQADWRGLISQSGFWYTTQDFGVQPGIMKSYSPDRSPIKYLEKLKIPVLLFHGGIDEAVAFKHATEFLVQAKIARKDIEALLPEDEGHVISRPENERKWLRKLIEFLETHL